MFFLDFLANKIFNITMELKEFVVKKEERLVKFLSNNVQGLSFSNLQKTLRNGDVKVNAKRCKENISLCVGDKVQIYLKTKSVPKVSIVYQDDNILIANKPAGIECCTKDKSGENAYSLEEIFEGFSAVHRLDRLTEGLVIMAKNAEVKTKLEQAIKDRKIEKFYKACIYGRPEDDGIKKAYLKKDEQTAMVKISFSKKLGYKEIITEYKIIEDYGVYSVVDIKLHTGRTHQIRGYFAHIGHAVLGDTKYSSQTNPINDYKGYFLTAYKLKFNLDKDLKYLNNKTFEISPSWIKYVR